MRRPAILIPSLLLLSAGSAWSARGGPDALGNRFIDSDEPDGPAVAFLPTTSALPFVSNCDDCYEPVVLPFSFPFYGQRYDSAFVHANGFLFFAPPVEKDQGDHLDSDTAYFRAIHAWWDDWDASCSNSSEVRIGTVGVAPERTFVVTWLNDRPDRDCSADPATFQLQLHEGAGEITFVYLDAELPGAFDEIGPISFAESGTIGIDSGAGDAPFLEYSSDVPSIHSNMAIRWSRQDQPVAELCGPGPAPAAWSWGADGDGQLGAGHTLSSELPVRTASDLLGAQVSGGGRHALAVDALGGLWSWGADDAGQLGLGGGPSVLAPTPIAAPSDGVGVAAGFDHSLAVTGAGAVWSWGGNASGQLGLGWTSPQEATPAEVLGLPGCSAVAAGDGFSLALCGGEVWVWGAGADGQLGAGSSADSSTPVLVDALLGHSIVGLSAGGGHVLALEDGGVVWAWGRDDRGQLGRGSVGGGPGLPEPVAGLPVVVSIAAGAAHCLVAGVDGSVFAWGAGDAGQVGGGSFGDEGSPLAVPGPVGVAQVAAGGSFSLARGAVGELWSWGAGDAGQLGDPAWADRAEAARVSGWSGLDCVGDVAAGADFVFARDCSDSSGLLGDTDGDRISDLEEGAGLPSPPDTDGGGVVDYLDTDSDNDGRLDCMEAGDVFLSTPAVDSDGDGVPDYLDTDSDGDSVPDAAEGWDDPDGDGIPSALDDDSDGDGIPDQEEGGGDADGDGVVDSLDSDTDGDGLPDALEGGDDPDGDGLPNRLDLDSDGDGIPDAVEGDVDSDGDGVPDYLDEDDDGDGIPDIEESGFDLNDDGIVDSGEADPEADPDGDGLPSYLDWDSDGDGLTDAMERQDEEALDPALDLDGDGAPASLDLDSDGDGIPDAVEGGDDVDGDGVPNYLDDDSDGDGIADSVEGLRDTDADGVPDSLQQDSDGDGVPDGQSTTVDANGDGVPDDGSGDLDGDGIPDYADSDVDGDGIANADEGTGDADGDGVPDYLDTDADNDGVPDAVEGGGDLDWDGVPDYLDTDANGDGQQDDAWTGDSAGDPLPPDLDGDGIPNSVDPDVDGDGIDNEIEGTEDADGDGLPNAMDRDSDGDGIPDAIEGTGDVDGDGLGDWLDPDPLDGPDADRDGDGVSNGDEEDEGLDPDAVDSDGDGVPDGVEWGADGPDDTDGDGVIDALDDDSDGDGISDAEEAGFDPRHPRDTDGDGVPDFQDEDSDGDGLSDAEELDLGTDRLRVDTDHDGVPDGQEVADGTDPRSPAVAPELVTPDPTPTPVATPSPSPTPTPPATTGCAATVAPGGGSGAGLLLLGLLCLGWARRSRALWALLPLGAGGCAASSPPPPADPSPSTQDDDDSATASAEGTVTWRDLAPLHQGPAPFGPGPQRWLDHEHRLRWSQDDRWLDDFGGGLAALDCDLDGDLDLLLTGGDAPDSLLINDGSGGFTRAPEGALPPRPEGVTVGVATGDVGGDGDDDALLLVQNAQNRLLIGDGACGFQDRTEGSGLDDAGRSLHAAFGDLDGDGVLDVYVSNWGGPQPDGLTGVPPAPQPDRLFLGRGDGTFRDATSALPPASDHALGMSVALLDFDGDGDRDIFQINDRGLVYAHDRLLRNDGIGADGLPIFSDVSGETGFDLAMNGMGIGVSDVDGDGDPDLLMTGNFETVLLDDPLGYLESGLVLGFDAYDPYLVSWSGAFFDADLDGDEDLVYVRSDIVPSGFFNMRTDPRPLDFLVNDVAGSGRFEAGILDGAAAEPVRARTILAADLDGDGVDDLVPGVVGESPRMLLSAAPPDRHRAEISLSSLGSVARGARISLTAGGRTQRRWIGVASPLGTSGPPRATFGLGDAESIDSIEVLWPSGSVQRLGPVPADTFIEVTER